MHQPFAGDEVNAIEYPKSHNKNGDIPIATMPRYCNVCGTLVDVLPAPYPDTERRRECNKTHYRDESIEPVLNPDSQPPKQRIPTDPLLS